MEKKQIQILPSINVQTFIELQERIVKVEPYVQWCHLDVTDGIFSKHKTWNNPRDLLNLDTTVNLEVHLMVEKPETILDQWLIRPINRVIVHREALLDTECLTVIEKCRKAGIQIGFAIHPETPWEVLTQWFNKVDLVQTLNVRPGASGQAAFWPETLGKIKHIREACPQCIIEVDGGVNPETAKKAVEAGASLLVSGAYVFNSKDIGEAINVLGQSVN